jgi:hypothetical protein
VNTDPDQRELLLRDEGNSQLHYVNLGNTSANWHVDVPAGRDMQLVGSGRVMIGTDNGYEEHDIATGAKVAELTTYLGTLSAHRLRNRNTMLVGVNWQGQSGIVLAEVDAGGGVVRTIAIAGYDYARIARPTPSGTFLVTSNTTVLEVDDSGNTIWQATINNSGEPHSWMPIRLPSGETVVSAGYAANLQFFSAQGTFLRAITGPSQVVPYFYAGYQILDNGNFVITNWQGHGAGHGNSGNQVLEYDPDGNLVWSWQQDASYVSSLQAVIVLDGLDLDYLHVDDTDGTLVPVP